MSMDDERRAVSQLICQFIHKVDYGNNFEQQLNFYVDSRANFTNLDPVITELIQVSYHCPTCTSSQLTDFYGSLVCDIDVLPVDNEPEAEITVLVSNCINTGGPSVPILNLLGS